MSTTTQDPPARKPFAAFLQENPDGVHSDATEKLHELIAAVRQEGKGGTLTLKVKVAPKKRTIEVFTDVTIAPPKPASDPSLWFVDKAGNPTRRDPDQPELPGMRPVASVPANVDPETGEVRDQEPVHA